MRSKTALVAAILLSLSIKGTGQQRYPFQVGEKLLYDASFDLIKAGHSELHVASLDTIDSSLTYHIVFTVKSNPLVDRIFKVRDHVETWLDEKDLFTRKLRKKIREGSYRKEFTATIDYSDSMLTSENKTLRINGVIRDPYSLFYYLRTIPLTVGDPLSFTTFDNDQFVDFQVVVHHKETVKVPAGKFRCLVIEPFRPGRSLFKSKGDMIIWLSDDERRLPVKIQSKAKFGSMTLKLREIVASEKTVD